MKRPLLLFALALAPLAACAPYYNDPGYDPYYGDGRAESGVPLLARLNDDLSVQLNRPAHVAIFEIIPGRGAGLLYPSRNSDASFVRAGYSRLQPNWSRPHAWYYLNDPVAYSRQGPRYYLLVASRHPLEIDFYRDEPGSLRRQFGRTRFASMNARRVMDDLVSAVLPAYSLDEDYDTDVLTVWPREQSRGGFWYDDELRMVRVDCGNGNVITVPVEQVSRVCQLYRPGQPLPPVAPPDTARPEGDSVTVPTRRRPEPKVTDGEGMRVHQGERIEVQRHDPEVEQGQRERPQFRVRDWSERPRGGEENEGRDRLRLEEPRGGNPRRSAPETRREEPRRGSPEVSHEGPRSPVRAEPREERPRAEPRVERPEPRVERPEPRVERPEPRPEPRVETPRVETPRVEAPRPESGGGGGESSRPTGGGEPGAR